MGGRIGSPELGHSELVLLESFYHFTSTMRLKWDLREHVHQNR